MKNDKEIAKRLYLSGMKLAEIANETEIPYPTLKGWSATEKWTDARLKEENLNDRISKIINLQIEKMEGEDAMVTRENVTMLKDLMSIRQSTRVSFVNRVQMTEELIKYAQEHKKHEDAQAVAEVAKDFIETEYNKLEE